MYKKLGQWQQERRDRGPRPTENEYGVDPSTWLNQISPASLPMPETIEDVILELGRLRVETTEIKNQIWLSQERFNGRRPGKSLSSTVFHALQRRRSEIAMRIARLEMRCSAERNLKRSHAHREDALKAREAKASLAETFMDMAKAMLAGEVYERVFIAAVHRHQDKVEGDEKLGDL